MRDRYHFPEELLIEIIIRLPIRSIVRFTAVSKSLFSFITGPAFVAAHLRHSRSKDNSAGSLLLLRRFDDLSCKESYAVLDETLTPITSLDLRPAIPCRVRHYRVIGCYNGVVCLSDNLVRVSRITHLWNPSIQKLKTLPPPTLRSCPFRTILGFGANPECADDLKVVRVVFGGTGLEISKVPQDVEIFSVITGKWRRISAAGANLHSGSFSSSPPTFAHGALHWSSGKWLENEEYKQYITVFSMADEIFGELMLPDELANDDASSLNMMEFGETIVVFKYGRYGDQEIHGGRFCDMWMMKEYGVVESWCRLHHIELVPWMQRIVGIRENGDLLMSTDQGELVSYCHNTEGIHKLGIYGSGSSYFTGKYLESLVLIQEQSCIIHGLSEGITSMSI
ncbi:unnamed protein product [Cuscuta campestris]|uniref:Uncharacterized protein n=1 Tax=Cuscuta campestris TaxID=132261 RepID=A0A484LV02_9ASTE|nr:unnamed protein product [Cuscuta campestris]